MENIIKRARLSRSITQREVARLADMSPQAVMRYEQGLYENLSMKLLNAISELIDIPRVVIETDYDSYRDWKQKAAGQYLQQPPPLYFNEALHPFKNFRQRLTSGAVGNESRMAFCILLAVHPATVAEYDEGKVKSMPALIERALKNAGLSDEYLKSLQELGEIWYERHS